MISFFATRTLKLLVQPFTPRPFPSPSSLSRRNFLFTSQANMIFFSLSFQLYIGTKVIFGDLLLDMLNQVVGFFGANQKEPSLTCNQAFFGGAKFAK